MFELAQDNEKLFKLIESGNLDKAKSLLLGSKASVMGAEIPAWFIENFRETNNPNRWLDFWVMIFRAEELSDFRADFINITYQISSLDNHERIESFYLKIMHSLIDLNRDEQNIILEYHLESILLLVPRLDHDEIDFLYNEVIKTCLCKLNAPLLHQLYSFDEQYFNLLKPRLNLDEEETKKFNLLLSYVNGMDRSELYEVMGQFTDGPGNIIAYGGQLTLGQFKHRKQLDMRCTIVEKGELSDYIELLDKASRPLKERFIISGAHWIAGQIEIKADGRTQILFIDSLGVDRSKNKFYKKTEKITEKFAEQFSNSKIYITFETRLFAEAGCSVISLDDVRHLVNIEQYLDKKYKETGLFGYLADAENGFITTNNKNIKVICCRLPLTFYRTMQSATLLNELIKTRSKEVSNYPINKRRKIFSDIAYSHFRMHDGKNRNMCVNYILGKFAKNNFIFFQQAKASSDEFTLEGCTNRLLLKQN